MSLYVRKYLTICEELQKFEKSIKCFLLEILCVGIVTCPLSNQTQNVRVSELRVFFHPMTSHMCSFRGLFSFSGKIQSCLGK